MGKSSHDQRVAEREMGHLINGDSEGNSKPFRDGPGFHEAMRYWGDVFGLGKKDDD
ncbi:MAG: hypothetical protein NT098_01405 [Candidatus Parcubacteria bacterium]|nr:hypothetical protein [Candidatus Parcubacteria bacterium]